MNPGSMLIWNCTMQTLAGSHHDERNRHRPLPHLDLCSTFARFILWKALFLDVYLLDGSIRACNGTLGRELCWMSVLRRPWCRPVGSVVEIHLAPAESQFWHVTFAYPVANLGLFINNFVFVLLSQRLLCLMLVVHLAYVMYFTSAEQPPLPPTQVQPRH